MRLDDWLLTPEERGNPAPLLDRRDGDGARVVAGQRGAPAGARRRLLHRAAGRRPRAAAPVTCCCSPTGGATRTSCWTAPAARSARCCATRPRRGVVVKGLVWRSHLDRLQFSERENRHLGEEIEAAGGECLLDMRVRPGGSHHQKFVVLRHPGRPERDVAFVGGIDLCHSRRDDADHGGDPQRACRWPPPYGRTPPWHDVQLAVRGPGGRATSRPLSASAGRTRRRSAAARCSRLRQLATTRTRGPTRCRRSRPTREPRGTHTVQVLRTYPAAGAGYPFAPDGERSIARGYRQGPAPGPVADLPGGPVPVVGRGRRRLRRGRCAAHPDLRMIAVVPAHPDQDGRLTAPMNLLGRIAGARRAAPGGRRPLRRLQPGEPRRDTRLRPREGVRHRRRLGRGRLRQRQPPLLDPRFGTRAARSSTNGSTRASPATPAGSATAPALRPRPAARLCRSTSTSDDARTSCATRPRPSTPSPVPPLHWTPGTAAADAARARPAGCARTPPPRCPARGRRSRPLHRLIADPDGRPRALRRRGLY